MLKSQLVYYCLYIGGVFDIYSQAMSPWHFVLRVFDATSDLKLKCSCASSFARPLLIAFLHGLSGIIFSSHQRLEMKESEENNRLYFVKISYSV